MNYGDRAMMRHELIRIVRLSYLLEFIVIESLGRCYIQNINDVLGMIELKDYDENYVRVMK
jgi:dynein heavy chain